MSDPSTEIRLQKEARTNARLQARIQGNVDSLLRLNQNKSGWALNLYQEAGEASGSFRGSARPFLCKPEERTDQERTFAQELARLESGRRARAQIRRDCAHNALNRLGTLTFKGEGCHDPSLLRTYLGAFFRELRQGIGREFPYLWVPEWHATHGLHAHFAVGRYISRSIIEAAWPHGFVHIKLLADLPHGSDNRIKHELPLGIWPNMSARDLTMIAIWQVFIATTSHKDLDLSRLNSLPPLFQRSYPSP